MNFTIRAAAIAATFLTSASFAESSTTANATLASPDTHFSVIVFADSAQGEALLNGSAETAIAALTPRAKLGRLRFTEKNNLCVAYIVSKKADLARSACELAVESSQRRAQSAHALRSVQLRRDHAIALTNRGVLSALLGNSAAAARDFERAAKLGRKLSEPSINLARLAERAPAVVGAVTGAR